MDHIDRSETDHFLNLETGEVITLPSRLVEAIRAGVKPEETDIPEWQLEDAPLAELVVQDPGGARFVRVPEARWAEEHRLRVLFAQAIPHEALREKVATAVYTHDGGLKFDDLLLGYPQLRAAWLRFQTKHKREWARRWLLLIGVRPVEVDFG
jgi:hypothetical protein